MNRRLWTTALLGCTLLASPGLAQQAARPAGTDIEKVRKNPDDTVALNTFFSERFRAIATVLSSDAAAAEKKLAELKNELATIKPTTDDGRTLMTRAKLAIDYYQGQVELSRVSLAELEVKLKAHPDDTATLTRYASKARTEIGEKVYSDTAAAEAEIAAVRGVLTGLRGKAGGTGARQIDATLATLKSYEKAIAAEKTRAALVGKNAAPLEVETWVNGSPLTDADLKGKVVLIDFWAVWCGPCIATFPHLREWNARYADKGLVMIGLTRYYNYEWDDKTDKASRASSGKVAPEKEQAMLLKFAAANQLTHRIGIPKSNATAEYYAVTGIPEVVVIDRGGTVRLIRVGSGDANAKAIGEMLEKLLGSASSGGQ
jgi:thiol-disulfide isomerase/thioredoxin